MNETNEDEKKLLEFCKNFNSFLNKKPKIRFNLHERLVKISNDLEWIENQLW